MFFICIYINRISRRTDHIYISSNVSQPPFTPYTCIYIQLGIYNFSYMLPSEPVAFALVPSEHDDNWEWFMGHVAFALVPAVAGDGILLWDL